MRRRATTDDTTAAMIRVLLDDTEKQVLRTQRKRIYILIYVPLDGVGSDVDETLVDVLVVLVVAITFANKQFSFPII
jgi:hypothetical protein